MDRGGTHLTASGLTREGSKLQQPPTEHVADVGTMFRRTREKGTCCELLPEPAAWWGLDVRGAWLVGWVVRELTGKCSEMHRGR